MRLEIISNNKYRRRRAVRERGILYFVMDFVVLWYVSPHCTIVLCFAHVLDLASQSFMVTIVTLKGTRGLVMAAKSRLSPALRKMDGEMEGGKEGRSDVDRWREGEIQHRQEGFDRSGILTSRYPSPICLSPSVFPFLTIPPALCPSIPSLLQHDGVFSATACSCTMDSEPVFCSVLSFIWRFAPSISVFHTLCSYAADAPCSTRHSSSSFLPAPP